jgi:hypothetical protein
MPVHLPVASVNFAICPFCEIANGNIKSCVGLGQVQRCALLGVDPVGYSGVFGETVNPAQAAATVG